MEKYIHNEDIRRYRLLLQAEGDEETRNIIRKLLAEEEAKDVLASAKDRRDKSKHP
jgi:SET domain-containing protein